MGSVNYGVPRQLVQHLQRTLEIGTFVETGTYHGQTARWASDIFPQVITIEGSSESHVIARQSHAGRGNIDFRLGDSRVELQAVCDELRDPALFWLDAHWMPGAWGAEGECPVLEEIGIIRGADEAHLILIDDARLFLAPPPPPHNAAHWPDIHAVFHALNKGTRYTVVRDDVIISVPDSARSTLHEYCRDAALTDLQPPTSLPQTGSLGRLKRFVRKHLTT